MKIILVTGAIIQNDNNFLIGRRGKDEKSAGLWEFPGGKCEPGETLPECLQRELHEELGVLVNVRECVETLEHAYPEKIVQLSFYQCALVMGEPEGCEGQSMAWVRPDELGDYQFPEADAQLLEKLKANPDWWGK